MKIITPIPNKLFLACSGGIDSMFAKHFLEHGKKDVTCLFFHHGTKTSDDAKAFLQERVSNLIIGSITQVKSKLESMEEYWRKERYNFFSQFNPVITCHHLDDQVENWIMTAAHGVPKLIPYKRDNYLRPFILCKKSEIRDYCRKHKVDYIEDYSNYDLQYKRNYVRHELVCRMLQVNPGMYSTVSKIIKKNVENYKK